MSQPGNFPIEQFLVERQDQSILPDTLICMDDRPTLDSMLYWQIGGGVDGLGRDIAIAKEIERPHSVIHEGRPLHVQTLAAAQTLSRLGIAGMMHEGCAAYGSALEVSQTIVKNGLAVFGVSTRINPEMTFGRFERVHATQQRIVERGFIVPTAESDKDLLNGVDELDMPPVPRLKLVDETHKAGDMIFDYGQDALWDVRQAFDDGSPAYFVGLGLYQELLRKHSADFGVSAKTVQDVTTVRHAALSLLLPKPEGQKYLNIHLREAA